MEAFNILFGLVIFAVVVGGAGYICWFWWIQPTLWAIDAWSYGWAVAIALCGPLLGMYYRERVTGTIPTTDSSGYTVGTVGVFETPIGKRYFRILRKLPDNVLYVRSLPGRGTVRA